MSGTIELFERARGSEPSGTLELRGPGERHRLRVTRSWTFGCLAAIAGMLLLANRLQAQVPGDANPSQAAPDTVAFFGTLPGAMSPDGVVIPPGRAVVWLAATAPPVFNERAEPGTRERYGDTKIQAAGVLRRIDEQLRSQGLSLANVVYLRVYLVADPAMRRIDLQGWQQAYAEQYWTQANPTRPALSTLGVAALGDPDWLVEIEAFAVFPE